MSLSIAPIYRAGKASLRIDTCAPQCAAIEGGKIKLQALTKGHYPGKRLKFAQLPGITSIGYWTGSGTQNWGLEPHRNEGVEITFLETGRMAFSVEANDFELRAGQFGITRPWQLHKLGAPNIGPGKLHWLILDVGVRRPNQDWHWPAWLTLTKVDCAQLTQKLRHNENPVWNASAAVANAFCELSNCVSQWPAARMESKMIVLLNQLFLGVLTALCEQQSHENPELTSRRHTVDLFLRDLAANPASARQPWTLQKMARNCGMGITAFSQYCRELVNTGPVDYVNQCRLDRAAREILEAPERPITQIAFTNGYNSSQYFATAFRKRFKMSPSEFRPNRDGN
jgi:AraC family L-rhamnose operon regulatory protein RhaS